MNRKHTGYIFPAILFCLVSVTQAAVRQPDEAKILMTSNVKYVFARQVTEQAATIAKDTSEPEGAQIRKVMDGWFEGRMLEIKTSLEKRFGQNAEGQFETFLSESAAAENRNDAEFLKQLATACEVKASDFPGLRKGIGEQLLTDDIQNASRLLGEIQTWVDVTKKSKDTPPLALWLVRKTSTAAASQPVQPAEPVRSKPAPTLADAEPTTEPVAAAKDDGEAPTDTFAELRAKRRDKVLKESQAGMQQVAAERQAAETELAAKKTAEATAEAENMKAQADRLAAVEKEALDQRQNSWSARFKSIVGATITSGVGAFTGGVGTRLADEATKAIFK